MQRFLAVAAAAAALAVGAVGAAFAHDASPQATPPGAVACTVEPRSVDEIVAGFFDPAGTPVATPLPEFGTETTETVLPQGEPADEATIAAVDATVREWVACFEAGQIARAFALMTDEAVALFGPDFTDPSADTAEEVREALEGQLLGTPIPGEEPAAEPSVLEGPREVRVLTDGRVGGIWGIEGDEAFLVLAEEDGRWLIDAFVDIIETDAAPAAATPAT